MNIQPINEPKYGSHKKHCKSNKRQIFGRPGFNSFISLWNIGCGGKRSSNHSDGGNCHRVQNYIIIVTAADQSTLFLCDGLLLARTFETRDLIRFFSSEILLLV